MAGANPWTKVANYCDLSQTIGKEKMQTILLDLKHNPVSPPQWPHGTAPHARAHARAGPRLLVPVAAFRAPSSHATSR